jgi:peptidoglycan hydrolase-like protein with peptidoglycan-binding domain
MATLLGFPVPAKGASLGTFLVPGTAVKLTVDRAIAPILIGFARDFDREVEELIPGQCGGYNPRRIGGSASWSRHAIGCAIDLNWLLHPQGRRNTFPAAKRRAIDGILGRYTYRGVRLLRHGKDYRTTPDDMHAELNVPRATAVAAVKALQGGGKPATPGPTPGSRTLRRGAVGADVAFLQRWVGAADDGRFGVATEARVRRYQRIVGVPVTGVVDAHTWAKILGR